MKNRKTISLVLIVALLAVFSLQTAFAAQDEGLAPLYAENSPTAIAGEYIVVLKADTGARANADAQALAVADGARIMNEYGTAINGFAAELTTAALDALRKSPDVSYIEANMVVSIDNTWGQDRVNQRNLPLDNNFSQPGNGAGVHAYIIDTGINSTHNEYSGRVGTGYNAVGANASDWEDCNGHGTHVAGTIGGSQYGIADAVTVHGVRVLGCSGSGSTAGVIDGMDWVAANHQSPAVANMSLGGGASTATDNAVDGMVAAGVTTVVAAGNSNANACNSSPARAAAAITVAASDSADRKASFSNWGPCVDIWAPGVGVTSAWIGGNNATNTISGTSMASPHVAGVAVLAVASAPSASPAQIAQAIEDSATRGAISNPGCTFNLLVYSPLTPAGTPVPPVDDCGGGGGCLVTAMGASGHTPAAQAETAALFGSMYAVRDEVFAGTVLGEHYTDLYYAHGERITSLIMSDAALRADAEALVATLLPGTRDMLSGRVDAARLSPEMVAQTRTFLTNLAAADNGGALAVSIESEMSIVEWDGLTGMTFREAWDTTADGASPTDVSLTGINGGSSSNAIALALFALVVVGLVVGLRALETRRS